MSEQETPPGPADLFGLIGGDEPAVDPLIGGKRKRARKSKKACKSKKVRKSKKQRGGGCGCSMN